MRETVFVVLVSALLALLGLYSAQSGFNAWPLLGVALALFVMQLVAVVRKYRGTHHA